MSAAPPIPDPVGSKRRRPLARRFAEPLGAALRANRAYIVSGWCVLALLLANASGVFRLGVDMAAHLPASLATLHSSEFQVLLLTGLLLAIALPLLKPIPASLLTLVAAIPVVTLGYLNTGHRPLIPLEYSLLTILLLFVINVVLAYYRETHAKQQIIDVFGQYAPPEVVDIIRQDPERFSMEGEARELSVMFCDVRNFTSISEGLEPRELAQLLNRLFTPLTRVLYTHKAVIDKYMGDAIMAFWGAPLADPGHAGNAVAAAFAIQEELVRLAPEFQERGWPAISMGIGINSGTMNVGNMGSQYRMAYTVIGDAVNVAARLQDLTRVYNAPIIVGEATRRAFPAVTYREIGLVQVKGKNAPARIYEPCNPRLDPESTVIANMQRHNEALRCYYGREWDVAEKLFQLLREARGEDRLYDYYLSRIAEYRLEPPPENWHGEIRYTVK